MIRIEIVVDKKEELEKVKKYFNNNFIFEDESLSDDVDVFCIEESKTHFFEKVNIDDDKIAYKELDNLKWDKIEINEEVLYDIDDEDAYELVRKQRFYKNNFGPITLYTTRGAANIFDEVSRYSKYANIFVVFNYESEDEYMTEL